MATAQDLISVAASQIGTSGTDNPYNSWYWGHPCHDPNTYPWCAAFVSWCASQAGVPVSPTAAASGVYSQLAPVPDDDVAPGDIVVYNWDGRTDTGWCDHVGIVEWFDHSSGYFGTIEGNAGNSAGGEVMRVTRYNYGSYFTAFARPSYDGQSAPAPAPAPAPTTGAPDVRYRVISQAGGLLPEMVNHTDTGGSGDGYAGDGSPILCLGIDMPGWYQVRTQASGWLPAVRGYDMTDLDNGCAGDGSPITEVRCYYETPDPDATGWLAIEYAVANVGEDFLADMRDTTDTGGSGDDYAGNGGDISAFRARIARV